MEFEEFGKIPRLQRDIVITEKIDGTNAQIGIVKSETDDPVAVCRLIYGTDNFNIYAGSRTRWLQPGKQDNFGFASWVVANMSELVKLGEGRHFGEWWGSGIQRGYGLPKGERRFSLFNVHRWGDSLIDGVVNSSRPSCCHVVPTLYRGPWVSKHDGLIMTDEVLARLSAHGSYAAPFMNPEGIIVFHTAGNLLFKQTLESDEKPKGVVND